MANGSDKAESRKRLFWRLHHWVGLYTGILIGVLSITGALAIFIPEIDALIQRHHYDAISTGSPAGTPHFGRSIGALASRFPDYRSLTISLPRQPDHAVQVDLIIPADSTITRYDFFIDGGTDQLLGQRILVVTLAQKLVGPAIKIRWPTTSGRCTCDCMKAIGDGNWSASEDWH